MTRECRRLRAEAGEAAIYPRLFRAFVQRYNWAYADGYADLPFIQQSFLFTLYLLQRFGGESRPHTFYEDAYLQAFPMLMDEVEARPYSTPETQLRNCYTLRTLERFAGFLGLAEMEKISKGLLARDFRVTKKPLLEQMLCFHVLR